MRPLDGVVVLDFSTLLPGPMASLILAEAGAEVIKVERPGAGDEMRAYPPFKGGESLPFAMLNRGKASLAVDLKSEAGRAELEPHLARADILIEQFRPGVMARIGLGYPTLAERFPQLIYCSITGFGQDGPKAQVAGHDLNYMAETGLLALSLGKAEAPVVPPALIADIAGGAYPAVMNILLALEARRQTGRGAHLDVSMTDNLFPLAWWALAQHAATGAAPGSGDSLLTGGTARYRLYPTLDGQVVAAAPIEQRFWDNFCTVLDLPEDLRDDGRDPQATLTEVSRIIGRRPGAHWAQAFDGVDCCCTLVASLDQALADPHFGARGLMQYGVALGDGSVAPALPVPLAPGPRGAPAGPIPAPPLGQNGG
ncbi:MAG: CaiB/BaiF CoA-transferase family protein [Rhodobacter sp.]|nr:CaiB/BaiF CoA-transferase family protein [Rhodobacter sp.]